MLVGVGTAAEGGPVGELMAQATLVAGADAGAPELLRAVDRIATPQGTWSERDPARTLARRIGAPHAQTFLYEIGVSQQEMIDEVLAAIGRGDIEVALVVGGEARAYARSGGQEDEGTTDPPDVTVTRPPDFIAPIESAAGIVWPVVQQYALIENALAAHEHRAPDAHLGEVAALWARFNEVAQGNPLAAFPTPRTAEFIATPAVKNRPLAHPYNLWHSTQWTVDQAAALLFCSAERAAATGIPRDRWVFPRVALHASQAITLTARANLFEWPAMRVLGRAAAAHLGRPLREIEVAEVYSCFPAAVRVQQRALQLDLDGTPTLTGGMAFAGGPFNNYVLQSTAAVVQRLRTEPAQLGLVTTVSGMLSKPGLAVWSCTPPPSAQGTLLADLADEAAAATATRPVADPDHGPGPATVVSYTVTYDAEDPLRPVRTAIVAERADRSRTAATCEDESIARHCFTETLIGRPVHLEHTTFTL